MFRFDSSFLVPRTSASVKSCEETHVCRCLLGLETHVIDQTHRPDLLFWGTPKQKARPECLMNYMGFQSEQKSAAFCFSIAAAAFLKCADACRDATLTHGQEPHASPSCDPKRSPCKMWKTNRHTYFYLPTARLDFRPIWEAEGWWRASEVRLPQLWARSKNSQQLPDLAREIPSLDFVTKLFCACLRLAARCGPGRGHQAGKQQKWL